MFSRSFPVRSNFILILKIALHSGSLSLPAVSLPPSPSPVLSTQTFPLFPPWPSPSVLSINLSCMMRVCEVDLDKKKKKSWGSVSRLTSLSTITEHCQSTASHLPRIKGKLVSADVCCRWLHTIGLYFYTHGLFIHVKRSTSSLRVWLWWLSDGHMKLLKVMDKTRLKDAPINTLLLTTTLCNVKGVAHSYKPTDNYHQLYSSPQLYEAFEDLSAHC